MMEKEWVFFLGFTLYSLHMRGFQETKNQPVCSSGNHQPFLHLHFLLSAIQRLNLEEQRKRNIDCTS